MEVVMFLVFIFIGIPILTVFFNMMRSTVDPNFKERMDQANKINKMYPNMDTESVARHVKTQDTRLKEEQALRRAAEEFCKIAPEADEETVFNDLLNIRDSELAKENKLKKIQAVQNLPDMDKKTLDRYQENLDFIAEEDRKLKQMFEGMK